MIDTIDWEAVFAQCPEPVPDAYHHSFERDATRGKIEWPCCDIPNGAETWWSVFDAWCWLSIYPRHRYAIETLVLAHVRLVYGIAAKRGRFWREQRADAGGADYFSIGLAAITEAVSHGALDRIGPEDDDYKDEFVAKYLGVVARNAMSKARRHNGAMTTDFKWVDEGGENEDALPPEDNWDIPEALIDRNEPLKELIETEEWERVFNALDACCLTPEDAAIVSLRREGRLTEAQIGDSVGLSRDQVYRSLRRVLRKAGELLDLDVDKLVPPRVRAAGKLG